jgi:hypothetical protein
MFSSACSFIVLLFTVSLHVSAYMAIFKCVGYFILIFLNDSASLLFFLQKEKKGKIRQKEAKKAKKKAAKHNPSST